MRGTKEIQGILLDKIKEYDRKAEELAKAYQGISKKVLDVFKNK